MSFFPNRRPFLRPEFFQEIIQNASTNMCYVSINSAYSLLLLRKAIIEQPGLQYDHIWDVITDNLRTRSFHTEPVTCLSVGDTFLELSEEDINSNSSKMLAITFYICYVSRILLLLKTQSYDGRQITDKEFKAIAASLSFCSGPIYSYILGFNNMLSFAKFQIKLTFDDGIKLFKGKKMKEFHDLIYDPWCLRHIPIINGNDYSLQFNNFNHNFIFDKLLETYFNCFIKVIFMYYDVTMFSDLRYNNK